MDKGGCTWQEGVGQPCWASLYYSDYIYLSSVLHGAQWLSGFSPLSAVCEAGSPERSVKHGLRSRDHVLGPFPAWGQHHRLPPPSSNFCCPPTHLGLWSLTPCPIACQKYSESFRMLLNQVSFTGILKLSEHFWPAMQSLWGAAAGSTCPPYLSSRTTSGEVSEPPGRVSSQSGSPWQFWPSLLHHSLSLLLKSSSPNGSSRVSPGRMNDH